MINRVQPVHPRSGVNGVDKANFWFSFGDSYTQTDFDPNGVIPQPGNPLGNPPYPGYTAVGGVNWIDLDTVVYNNSLVLTYNYAYGGATINASLVAPYEPTVLSLIDQVNEFLSTVADKPATAPWTSENALFSVWIGINDIGNSYYLGGDRDAFSDTLLDSYFGQVQELMLAQDASAQALEKQVIAGYNTKLAARAASFQAANTGVKTWLWDSNAAFTTVLNNPTAYGFVDATSYGNTGDFWGNNYHPSSAAHDIWARDVAAVLKGTVW
ncbi:Carbohydrate Esterase Family 16 protein [Trametes cinnabarina]|uniref:Carbohydrate Esterase Family 16 protein n=1 Tax=Pycnoporus cinnabarinus TaxID=5643 RepID=A0A060ST67_PYCCI|nr:Carbohydrate Esterase Family 16 protein [Trametes cinnabarina]